MTKREVPCTSGEYCHKCWHNDTCRLYQYRKRQKQQMSDCFLDTNAVEAAASIPCGAEEAGEPKKEEPKPNEPGVK